MLLSIIINFVVFKSAIMYLLIFFSYLETESTLEKYQEEMKGLDETLSVEQASVQEVRQQIGEFKKRMAAQNQEISKRIASKEQRETQVSYECASEFDCDFILIHIILIKRWLKVNYI